MTAPPNAHNKFFVRTRNNSYSSRLLQELQELFDIFCLLFDFQQQNRQYPTATHRIIHKIWQNKPGMTSARSIPAAIQNNANPTILFTDTHLLFVHYMYTATKNVCYFSASSRILFTSSSVTLSSFRDVKRSITSGTISSSFVIVS